MLSSLASRYTRQFAFAASRTFASQSGDVFFITGASSGMGYQTAKIMAAAGYKVVATARRKDKLEALVKEIEADGGTAAAVRLDVTEDDDFETAFSFAEEKFGGVDHVFLNAGQSGLMKGPGDMEGAQDTATFNNILRVNVRGCLLGMKHGIKYLRKRGGGTIMTNSSNGGGWSRGASDGQLGDLTFVTDYCITSSALDQLVRNGAYYQSENIRVYGLKTGVYRSSLIDEFLDYAQTTEQWEGMDEEGIANFNFFFKGLPGDPVHIGNIVKTITDGSTQWVPGSNISCDNDATFDAQLQYSAADTDEAWPNVTMEDLRGYDGGPYEPQEERTKAYIDNILNPPEEE